ncbi:MAG: hypothetical protein ACOX6V_00270 [Patescibacteria group bacterium]|jgi:hypothetical protein
MSSECPKLRALRDAFIQVSLTTEGLSAGDDGRGLDIMEALGLAIQCGNGSNGHCETCTVGSEFIQQGGVVFEANR